MGPPPVTSTGVSATAAPARLDHASAGDWPRSSRVTRHPAIRNAPRASRSRCAASRASSGSPHCSAATPMTIRTGLRAPSRASSAAVVAPRCPVTRTRGPDPLGSPWPAATWGTAVGLVGTIASARSSVRFSASTPLIAEPEKTSASSVVRTVRSHPPSRARRPMLATMLSAASSDGSGSAPRWAASRTSTTSVTAERQGLSSLRTMSAPERAEAFQSMRRTSSPGR